MTSEKSDKSFSKWLLRKVFSGTITLLFIVLAGGLIWQGTDIIADRANAVASPEATDPVAVRVGKITTQDSYTTPRSFAGQIEAPQTVDIAFESSGTIRSVFFDEGESVKMGDVLATLDDRLLQAELNRLKASRQVLEAQKELAVLTNERQTKLKEQGFASGQAADQSRLSVAEFAARIAEMDAAILAAEIRIEKAVVKAPFDGRVDQRMIDPGAAINSGQAVLQLVEEGSAVFRVGIVPELANAIQNGNLVDVLLGNREVPAEVIAVLPKIDPATRTRIVRAELKETNGLAFGQTGQLLLPERIEVQGSRIPLGAIEDGVRGLWTIKTINNVDQPVVSIEAVEIIHAEERQAYVRGTFDPDSLIILDGMHRVVSGQRVRIANQDQ